MTGSFAYTGRGLWDGVTTRTDTERFVRLLNPMPNLENLLVSFDYWHPAELPNMPMRQYLHLDSKHGHYARRIEREGHTETARGSVQHRPCEQMLLL